MELIQKNKTSFTRGRFSLAWLGQKDWLALLLWFGLSVVVAAKELLASVLLFTVLFSTASESPTYIIAFIAPCIWYVMQTPARWKNALFIFVLIGTSFSHSDLVTPWVKHHIVVPYAFKAFPCLLMWLVLVCQIWQKQFLQLREGGVAPVG